MTQTSAEWTFTRGQIVTQTSTEWTFTPEGAARVAALVSVDARLEAKS